MMRAAWDVARWEFFRYGKPRQQLAGMLITFVIFGGVTWFNRASERAQETVRDVGVIGTDALPLPTEPTPSLRFTEHELAESEALLSQVREGALDGLLVVHSADSAELMVRRQSLWTRDVQGVLTAARQRAMMERSGLEPAELQAILAPLRLEVRTESGTGRGSRGERVLLVIVVTLMLMTVFIGMSYIFASITGEKQIRVTEQVVSAIPAQAWIDGKIIGLMGVSVVGVLAQVVAFVAVFVVLYFFAGVPFPSLPRTTGDPALIVVVVLFALLGLAFWFAFLGAVAATISDPHSSTRGSLLFVPVFASGLAYMILNEPESVLARVISLLPPTAPTAMPVRILATDVHAAEIGLSLGLLLASILLLRVAAGRIFRLAMLMYGKEPTWSEMRRAALER